MLPDFLDADNLKWAILGVLAVVAMAMFLVIRVVQKVVLRVAMLAILGGLGLSLWVQRSDLDDCVQTCECSLYGQDVEVTYDQLPTAIQSKIDAGDAAVCPNIVRPG